MAQDSRSPSVAAIPMPAAELDVLYHTCMSLKEAVETMQGTRGAGATSRVFTQNDPPPIQRDGDFWLSTGTSTTLNVSYSGRWFVVGTLT